MSYDSSKTMSENDRFISGFLVLFSNGLSMRALYVGMIQIIRDMTFMLRLGLLKVILIAF